MAFFVAGLFAPPKGGAHRFPVHLKLSGVYLQVSLKHVIPVGGPRFGIDSGVDQGVLIRC